MLSHAFVTGRAPARSRAVSGDADDECSADDAGDAWVAGEADEARDGTDEPAPVNEAAAGTHPASKPDKATTITADGGPVRTLARKRNLIITTTAGHDVKFAARRDDLFPTLLEE